MSIFGKFMTVKAHNEAMALKDAALDQLAGQRIALREEVAALRPDAEKHRASIARLAKANAKRKADALAKKAERGEAA